MTDTWSEDSSNIYRQLAKVAVPNRAGQIAALLMLLPFGTDEAFQMIELASGEGLLEHALLRAFPNANLLALDGSDSMRQTATHNLAEFKNRVRVDAFDIHDSVWHEHINGADVVLSSLCVHHLDGDEKQMLFTETANRISERGMLLLADLIAPQRPEAKDFFAATLDASAKTQSENGLEAGYELFLKRGWNHFLSPSPVDKPSPLFHQLQWMQAAGFAVVDCFWMQAGHAIYGGYKSASTPEITNRVLYADALAAAQEALSKG